MSRFITTLRFPDDWPEFSLGDVTRRVTTRNNVGNTNVLTISAAEGLINQEEFFKRRIASTDLRPYFLLKTGDFAYNKSYSAGYPVGVIRRLDRYPAGVVSPLYICFRIDREILDLDFAKHFFAAGVIDPYIAWIAKEGARNHGLLNVAVGDFYAAPVRVPPISEQLRIAEILNTLDDQIRANEQVIVKLENIKLGLLQDLIELEGSSSPRVAIGDIANTYSGGTPSRAVPGMYNGNIPWVKSGEVNKSTITSTEELITPAALRTSSARWVPAKVPLIAMYGATAGVVSWTGIPVTTNQAVLAVLPSSAQIDPRWLYWSLVHHSPTILAAVQGSGQPNLSKGTIDNYRMAVPDLTVQQRVADVLDTHESLIAAEHRVLAKSRTYKHGVVSDLLTGRYRVLMETTL